MKRRLVPVAVAACLALLVAVPALAGVTDSGTKYCSGDDTPWTRAYSTGYTEHYPPGNGYDDFYNGPTWRTTFHHASSGSPGGFWVVETNGSLNDPGTYAYCSAIS